MRSLLILILALTLASQASAQPATDRLRLTRGNDAGEVTDMSPLEVTVNSPTTGEHKVPVNTIKAILFHGEPSELSQARVSVGNGSYDKALVALKKVDSAELKRDFVKQEAEFFKAYCAAKSALAGSGEIGDAGRQFSNFVRAYPKNYHYLEAAEIMGDLLMAGARYEPAEKFYGELAKAPWPDYKMRAAVAMGRSLQAQKKHPEAIKQFEAALAIDDDSPDGQKQKLAATLGKAVSLAESGKEDEAVGTIEKIIQDADPTEKELQARAHNALGACYEKAGRNKDALFSYLYVDVVYNTVPDSHAEALARLATLWKAVGQEERSREARKMLQDKYAGSRWARETQ
jgi:tetratricopeptide (TPR) repeat protein